MHAPTGETKKGFCRLPHATGLLRSRHARRLCLYRVPVHASKYTCCGVHMYKKAIKAGTLHSFEQVVEPPTSGEWVEPVIIRSTSSKNKNRDNYPGSSLRRFGKHRGWYLHPRIPRIPPSWWPVTAVPPKQYNHETCRRGSVSNATHLFSYSK